jgi:hypothetical protein
MSLAVLRSRALAGMESACRQRRAQVGAHGHDDGPLLGCQMFVDFRHGGTLQQKVLHLVFENAHPAAPR